LILWSESSILLEFISAVYQAIHNGIDSAVVGWSQSLRENSVDLLVFPESSNFGPKYAGIAMLFGERALMEMVWMRFARYEK
jgi:hypothetical protein